MARMRTAGPGLRNGGIVGRFDHFHRSGLVGGVSKGGMARMLRAGPGLRTGSLIGQFDHYLSFPFSASLQFSNARRTGFVRTGVLVAV